MTKPTAGQRRYIWWVTLISGALLIILGLAMLGAHPFINWLIGAAWSFWWATHGDRAIDWMMED